MVLCLQLTLSKSNLLDIVRSCELSFFTHVMLLCIINPRKVKEEKYTNTGKPYMGHNAGGFSIL